MSMVGQLGLHIFTHSLLFIDLRYLLKSLQVKSLCTWSQASSKCQPGFIAGKSSGCNNLTFLDYHESFKFLSSQLFEEEHPLSVPLTTSEKIVKS